MGKNSYHVLRYKSGDPVAIRAHSRVWLRQVDHERAILVERTMTAFATSMLWGALVLLYAAFHNG